MVQHKVEDRPSESVTKARVLRLPVKNLAASPAGALTEQPSDDASQVALAQAYERFQVQVRLDVEQERELLYKSLLVVEVLVFLFVLRELLLRWLA